MGRGEEKIRFSRPRCSNYHEKRGEGGGSSDFRSAVGGERRDPLLR